MPKVFTKHAALCLASMQLCFSFGGLSAVADTPPKSKTLKGGVTEQGEKDKNPGLSRTDINNPNDDPFSGNEKDEEEIDVPNRNLMKMDPVRHPDHAPPPKQALKGNIADKGSGKMQDMMPKGNPLTGDDEPMPNFPEEQPKQSMAQQNDPDNNPEMQLLWDIWHHRVAEAIYTRFNFLAKLGFKHSPPLLCGVSYVVTRDGHITNMQYQQKSPNMLFNIIVFQTVKSLDGDANLLTFPQGSRRSFVPKVGTFTQNYGGDGFKYTTGDKETVQQGR